MDSDDGLCPTHGGRIDKTEAGKKGGEATARAWAKEGLDSDDLPALDSYAAAKTWLERVGRAVATGKMRDRDGAVVVRAVQEWARTHGDELTSEVMGQLKRRVGELEAELKRSKMRTVR